MYYLESTSAPTLRLPYKACHTLSLGILPGTYSFALDVTLLLPNTLIHNVLMMSSV